MSTAQQRPFTPEPTPLLEEEAAAPVEAVTSDAEWVGEKTILIAENSNPQAWLQRVESGEWLCLPELPAILGRHDKAAVVLDDPSVSRRHAQLVRDGEHGYAIEDLGSSNGVRVAGNRVERMMLLDGDEFSLGNVVMRFNSHAPDAMTGVDAATSAAAASAGQSEVVDWKRLLPIGAAAVMVVVGLSMFATRMPRTVVVPEPQVATAPNTAAPASSNQLSPNQGSLNQGAAVQVASVQVSGGQGTTLPAASPAAPIQPPASADAAVAPAATTASEPTPSSEPITVQDEPVVRVTPDAPKEVAPDLASANLRKLERPAPESQDAAAPTTGAAAPPDPAELARSLAAAPVQPKPRAAPTPRERSQPIRRSSEFSRAYIDASLQMYLDGDSANSIRRLGVMSRSLRNQKQFRDEAAVLQQQVQALVDNYQQGQSALDRGDRAEAAASWARFLRDEGELFGGSTSVYAKRISRVVAEQYVRDGDQASADGRFHDAYRLWTKALQYEPDGAARDSIAQLELKGQQLFREGYRLESVSIERAKALWTEVTELLPPGTEYHTKARAKLRWHEQGGR